MDGGCVKEVILIKEPQDSTRISFIDGLETSRMGNRLKCVRLLHGFVKKKGRAREWLFLH